MRARDALFLAALLLSKLLAGEGHGIPLRSRTIGGVVLGKATIQEAIKRFGQTVAYETGDAALSERKVCFGTMDGSRILVFASNHEMAQGKKITSIRLYQKGQVPQAVSASACSELRARSKFDLESGLGLGMTSKICLAILGEPKTRGHLNPDVCERVAVKNSDPLRTDWTYSWSERIKYKKTDPGYVHMNARRSECFEGKDPYYDVGSFIIICFKQDAAVAIIISRIESAC